MSRTSALPLQGMQAGFRRFSVAEYHRLAEIGILTEDDNLELIEGYLVHKMSRNPPHDGTLHLLMDLLLAQLPRGWKLRVQSALTLLDSEPEPDLALVRPDPGNYRSRHPGPADVGFVVEVADSMLAGYRTDKARIYARAGIATYWIVNIPDRQIEVYDQPSGLTVDPAYARRQDFHLGDSVPLVVEGQTHVFVAVADLLG